MYSIETRVLSKTLLRVDESSTCLLSSITDSHSRLTVRMRAVENSRTALILV